MDFTDRDWWGLQNALQHGIQSGYFKGDNRKWAKAMSARITDIRLEQITEEVDKINTQLNQVEMK